MFADAINTEEVRPCGDNVHEGGWRRRDEIESDREFDTTWRKNDMS